MESAIVWLVLTRGGRRKRLRRVGPAGVDILIARCEALGSAEVLRVSSKDLMSCPTAVPSSFCVMIRGSCCSHNRFGIFAALALSQSMGLTLVAWRIGSILVGPSGFDGQETSRRQANASQLATARRIAMLIAQANSIECRCSGHAATASATAASQWDLGIDPYTTRL